LSSALDATRAIAASDGTNYLLTYSRGGKLFAQRLDTAPVEIGDGELGEILWDGSSYVVVFANDKGIQSTRVASDGRVIDTKLVSGGATNARYSSPVASWSGANLYVAWSDDRLSTEARNADVIGRVVDSGIDTLISAAAPQQHVPSIAFGANRFLIAWTEERLGSGTDTFIARMTSDGTRMDGRGVRLSTTGASATKPDVVFDGTNFVVAWIATANGKDSVITTRVSPDGAVLDFGGINQFNAEGCIDGLDLGIDGAVPLAVWTDCNSGHVYAARITRGGIMALASVAIAQVSPDGVIAKNPSVAWNGKTFLIAWEEGAAIRAARVTSTLDVIDTAPIAIASNGSRPSVAAAGDEFLVAYESNQHVFARRVNANDTIDLGAGKSPAASRDGSRFFVAWETPSEDLAGAHIDAPNENVDIITTEFPDRDIALIATPNGLGVAYSRVANDKTYGGVYRVFFRSIVAATRHRAARH
jgi:hypothetical protein